MPSVSTETITTISFDNPAEPSRRITLKVRDTYDKVLGALAIASEGRVSKVMRTKFIRDLLTNADGWQQQISLHDALRLVEHCEQADDAY